MNELMDALREFSFASVVLRLVLAMLFGGMLGIQRTKKRSAAGFRTYMLVCIGATLAMILGQYESVLLADIWSESVEMLGTKVDVARFGAQCINGIGFLGAGMIMVTGRQEVKGLTTAAGLWASACAGLAIGAGFYECAIVALVLMWMSIALFPHIEAALIAHSRNMSFYVELKDVSMVGDVIACIKEQNANIFDVDINRSSRHTLNPSAVFEIRLGNHISHAEMLARVSNIEGVTVIKET